MFSKQAAGLIFKEFHFLFRRNGGPVHGVATSHLRAANTRQVQAEYLATLGNLAVILCLKSRHLLCFLFQSNNSMKERVDNETYVTESGSGSCNG
jgi:hypothetical protein